MKKIVKFLFVFSAILMNISCDFLCEYFCEGFEDAMKIKNDSTDKICYFVSYGRNSDSYGRNSDTLIPQKKPQQLSILTQKKHHIIYSEKKWEKVLVPPHDIMRIFILSESVVKSYEWNEIRDKYMILQRYDLSLSDLERLNFEVTYPPNEAMKDIKMYPPYGSE
jgi:hypothetical protein